MKKKLSGVESKHFLKKLGRLPSYKQRQITTHIQHHPDNSITLMDMLVISSIDSTLVNEDFSLNINTSGNDFSGGGGEFSGAGSSSEYESSYSSNDSSSSIDSSSSDCGSSGGGD